MNQELKQALKVINEHSKKLTYEEHRNKLRSQKLDKLIYSLKSEFQMVDGITLNYFYTQRSKKLSIPYDNDNDQYTPTELGKSEKKNALEALYWFKKDIELCIGHLENN